MSSLVPGFIGAPHFAPQGKKWRIGGELAYVTRLNPKTLEHDLDPYEIKIPVNFLTDFATIPRILWILLPKYHPDYAFASVIHDYLYKEGIGNKRYADLIFLEGMGVLNCPWYKKWPMYYAVHKVGQGSY